jgi:hypothetical protein
MKPLFEIPELLTLSGDPFSFGAGLLGPGSGCSTGCDDGCNSGCVDGGGKGKKPGEPEV